MGTVRNPNMASRAPNTSHLTSDFRSGSQAEVARGLGSVQRPLGDKLLSVSKRLVNLHLLRYVTDIGRTESQSQKRLASMKWLAALVAVVVASYAVYKLNFPTYSHRYRLEMSLAIEGKVHTGSSVIEVNWSCGPKLAGLAQCASGVGGQATVIDLGSRGVVVATLYTGETVYPVPDGAVDVTWLCANAFGNRSTTEDLPKLPLLKGRRGLTPKNLPRLAWFSNPADPQTARKVTIENVASILDPTAQFTEAWVEITRDPIVVDIAKKLPWYPALVEAQKGKGIHSEPGKFQLIYKMFVGENTT